jgi:integrase
MPRGRKRQLKRNDGEGSRWYDQKRGLFFGYECGSDGNPLPTRSSKTEAGLEAKLLELREHDAKGLTVVSVKGSVAEYLNNWAKLELKPKEGKRESGLKRNTMAFYQYIILKHLTPPTPKDGERPNHDHFGNTEMKKLDAKTIQLWISGLEVKYAPRTVRHIFKVLQRALAYAVLNGDLRVNPCTIVKLSPKPKKKVIPMFGEDAAKFLAAANQSPLAVLYNTMFRLGLRRGETLALQWSNISEDWRTLSIENTVSRVRLAGEATSHLVVDTPKTQSGKRIVTLGAGLVALLKKHKKALLEWRMAHGRQLIKRDREPIEVLRAEGDKRKWSEEDLIFPTSDGTLMEPRNLNRDFSLLLKTAKLTGKGYSPHKLRHGFATAMLDSGEDIRVVSEFLGHADTRTTQMLYQHPTQTHLSGVSDAFERYITTIAPEVKAS